MFCVTLTRFREKRLISVAAQLSCCSMARLRDEGAFAAFLRASAQEALGALLAERGLGALPPGLVVEVCKELSRRDAEVEVDLTPTPVDVLRPLYEAKLATTRERCGDDARLRDAFLRLEAAAKEGDGCREREICLIERERGPEKMRVSSEASTREREI